ncbi:MAG: flagellar motor protein MotB [Actinomycetota bacterium]
MSHGSDGGLPEEHEEHVNHEAWVIPYADLLTLLMAMFIALFAMSSVDIDKFKSLSIGFNEALGGGELSTGVFDPDDGGEGPLDGDGGDHTGGAIGPDREPESDSVLQQLFRDAQANAAAAVEQAIERESLQQVEDQIRAGIVGSGFAGGDLELEPREDGLLVRVSNEEILFDVGDDALRPEGARLLDVVGAAIASVDNDVIVIGHTDSDPINTPRFASNTFLSVARASKVVDYFRALGISGSRLTTSGKGADEPVVENTSLENKAKNRRVEIFVQSNLVQSTLDDAGLGSEPIPGPDAATPDAVDIDSDVDSIVPDLGG